MKQKVINKISSKSEVKKLVKKAREAQGLFNKLNQQKVDKIVTAVAWAICKPSNNKKISKLAVQETGLGNSDDKIL